MAKHDKAETAAEETVVKHYTAVVPENAYYKEHINNLERANNRYQQEAKAKEKELKELKKTLSEKNRYIAKLEKALVSANVRAV